MGITQFLAEHITVFINQTGYITVFICMVMESMVFPIPSEAVMPFAGFLVAEHRFTFAGVIIISTLASITGSLVSYAMGYYGGKPIVKKFGRYLLLDEEELAFTERFFHTYGDATIFISRFIPVVRHLISIPAGVGRMKLWKFCLFTFLGAGLWNSFLTVCGFYLRQNWGTVMKYSHIVDIVVVAFLALLIILYVYRHIRKMARKRAAHS
jgi:membrane protein DedA with SNARE-associated domain